MNDGTSWSNGVAPSSGDVALWSNVASTRASGSLSADTSWGSIDFASWTNFTITAGNTLTLDTAAGIRVHTPVANNSLTINCGITLATAQTWSSGGTASRALTVGGPITNNGYLLTCSNANPANAQATPTLTITGSLFGTGGLAMNGPGILDLSGENSALGGAITLTNGTLLINSSTALGTNTLVINGGEIDNTSMTGQNTNTLAFNNNQIWNADFSYGGARNLNMGTGTVSLGSTPGIRTINTRGAANLKKFIVNGSIADGIATGLAKTNTGALSLGGSNVYSGPTIAGDGILMLTSSNAVPGGIGASGGTSPLLIAGGVIGLATNDFARGVGTNGSQVRWAGDGGFAALGSDRAVNLGGLTGMVTWASGGFVPATNALILSSTYATHKITFQNPMDLNGGARTVQVDNGSAPAGSADAELTGTISGTGNVVKTGNGSLRLTHANTFGGPGAVFRLAAGTLQIGHSSALGAPGTTFNLRSSVGGNDVTLDNISGAALTLDHYPMTWSNFTFQGSADLSFGTGAVTLAGTPIVTVNGSSQLTAAGIVGGTSGFGLTKAGGGTLYLSHPSNTFDGPLWIQNGNLAVVSLADGGPGGNGTGPIRCGTATSQTGGLIYTNGPGVTTTRPLDLPTNSGGADLSGSGSGPLVFAAPVFNTATGIVKVITLQGTTGGTIQGVIQNDTAKSVGVTAAGGTWLLACPSNTYTGPTVINSPGILSVAVLANGSAVSGVGASSGSDTNLVFGGGTLRYTGGSTAINRNYRLGTASGTLDIAQSNTTLTLSGASAAQAGQLVKTGPGTLELSATNLHTGITLINNGVLLVNGSLAGGASATNAGTLGGTGRINGKVTISAGATVNPGGVNTVGTLSTGSNTWDRGGSYTFEVSDCTGSSGTGYDQLVVSNGAITVTASNVAPLKFTINLVSVSGGNPGQAAHFNRLGSNYWTIARTTTGIANFNPSNFTINASRFLNYPYDSDFHLINTNNTLMLIRTNAAFGSSAAVISIR